MSPSPQETEFLTLDALRNLAVSALRASGAGEAAAFALAEALVAAEADGLPNHGVARLPMFCDHLRIGKIDGHASPVVTHPSPSIVLVDAAHGLAHTAIDLGLPFLVEAARRNGIAALVVKRAHSAHVIGYHTERIAEHGLIAMGFANAPASIAPVGGKKPVLGTNPISFAVPRDGSDPIVVDQAASVIAKSEIVDRARANEDIPIGWALDEEGRPTTSSKHALKGTMMPAGGYKGVNMALMAEALSAVVSGGTLGTQTLPFADPTDNPMELGQCFIAIDAATVSGGTAADAVEVLAESFASQGARLPGSRRMENRRRANASGVYVDKEIHKKIVSYTQPYRAAAS